MRVNVNEHLTRADKASPHFDLGGKPPPRPLNRRHAVAAAPANALGGLRLAPRTGCAAQEHFAALSHRSEDSAGTLKGDFAQRLLYGRDPSTVKRASFARVFGSLTPGDGLVSGNRLGRPDLAFPHEKCCNVYFSAHRMENPQRMLGIESW